jgi:hypothetical protein
MNRSAKIVRPLGRSQAQMGGLFQKEIKVLNVHCQYICMQRMPEENPLFRKFRIVRRVDKHQVPRNICHDSLQSILSVFFRSFAWIDHSKIKKGYEIPVDRRFYVFTPPSRPLEEIDAELKQVTDRILEMIGGLSA